MASRTNGEAAQHSAAMLAQTLTSHLGQVAIAAIQQGLDGCSSQGIVCGESGLGNNSIRSGFASLALILHPVLWLVVLAAIVA
eukprot:scaffold178384_cov19-Tisochrysis_lutea.AAC.1